MAVNNPTNSQQALGIADAVAHGSLTLVTPLALADGGTGASLVAADGGIVYSDATGLALVSPTSTANQVLLSGNLGMPGWSSATYPAVATGTGTILRANGTNWVASTATYPDTATAGGVVYATATNVYGQTLSTPANAILINGATNVPAWGNSLAADFTFLGNVVGATRTLTLRHSSNTASSAVNFIVRVAGATAGDAWTTMSTTTTEWSYGVDNSITSPTVDPFVISQGAVLGTNNVMSVATSGEINYPLQPSFLGYLAATATDKTGNGTAYTIGTDALTEVYDYNSDFTTAGVFTAPVTGIYDLRAQVTVTGNTIATTFVISIVTTARTYTYTFTKAAGAEDESVAISTLADMTAANTATVTITVSGEAGDTSDIKGGAALETYFCGTLVA